jgi:hypothetical protein
MFAGNMAIINLSNMRCGKKRLKVAFFSCCKNAKICHFEDFALPIMIPAHSKIHFETKVEFFKLKRIHHPYPQS